jgi:ABC-type sugar transport system ATPase subunit
VLDDLGFGLPAAALLSDLTIGQQQLVATARAAMRGTQFLIFDEPTAYLTRQESAQLFKLIRRLQAKASPSSISATAWKRFSSLPTAFRCCATAPMSARA